MRFLVAIHRPLDYDGSQEGPDMAREIDDLNDAMEAAGARFFAGGLRPPAEARSLRASDNGIVETPGLYLQAGEHVGGFWILDCPSLEDAVEWGRKAVAACRANVEVRPFF